MRGVALIGAEKLASKELVSYLEPARCSHCSGDSIAGTEARLSDQM
jgi:cytochrome c-type biogenesis protein CcmH/NrfF